MKVTFRKFALAYSILILLTIVSCTTNLFPDILATGLLLLFSTLGFLGIHIIGKKTAVKLKIRFDEADSEELEREDDVLLQGVTFASAILFFYINLFSPETSGRIVLSFGLAFLSIPFYVLRACGKIRNSPRLRYYSIHVFFYLVSLYFLTISVSIVDVFFQDILSYPYLLILFSPLIAAYVAIEDLSRNFKKRYSFKGLARAE